MSAPTKEKLLNLIREMARSNGGEGWLLPLAVTVLVAVLSGLVLWTYLTRQRGPGLGLSCAWIMVSLFAVGMGFSLPLPPALDNALGNWIGAILVTGFACIAARISGIARYFGAAQVTMDLRLVLRRGGLLAALWLALYSIGFGYGFLYNQVTGHPLESQFVALLLKCNTTSDFVTTLLAGGLLIPFCEELFYRGFLFGALERRWGGIWALGVSSVLFAGFHGLTYFPVLLFYGLAFGWLRLCNGDLRQSILLHALNNSLSIVLMNYFQS